MARLKVILVGKQVVVLHELLRGYVKEGLYAMKGYGEQRKQMAIILEKLEKAVNYLAQRCKIW